MAHNGAGDGNRTHVTSLEGWSSAIELHPPASAIGIRFAVRGRQAEKWSGRRDSDSRHPPWQGGTLPLSYYRTLWCLGAELNHRHVDFQSTALPTELPRHSGDPEGARTLDLQRDRLAF